MNARSSIIHCGLICGWSLVTPHDTRATMNLSQQYRSTSILGIVWVPAHTPAQPARVVLRRATPPRAVPHATTTPTRGLPLYSERRTALTPSAKPARLYQSIAASAWSFPVRRTVSLPPTALLAILLPRIKDQGTVPRSMLLCSSMFFVLIA
jgi:hypothetical protein